MSLAGLKRMVRRAKLGVEQKFDLFVEFLDHHRVPPGPLLMRDLAFIEALPSREQKRKTVQHIMQTLPDHPFVLIGDSGQSDAGHYLDRARHFPRRVAAIFIRSIDGRSVQQSLREEFASLGVPFLETSSTVEMARHAAAKGSIAAGAVEEVIAEAEQRQ